LVGEFGKVALQIKITAQKKKGKYYSENNGDFCTDIETQYIYSSSLKQ
jgi:hypothetical protein